MQLEASTCAPDQRSTQNINGFNEANVAMTDKQLINSTDDCVRECLYGFSHLHPHLAVDYATNVVFDVNDCSRSRVSIVSGGGSGHEPFPAGYVGSGMLTASVSGALFTSPPSKHILQAIHIASAKSAGVLLLVPNYTGDVLNFGLAAETALQENIPVKTVIVGEDVSQEVCGVSKAGKRGMCGLVLVFKIAGYLASTGCDLTTIAEISEWAVRSMASMGLCTSACCKPGVGPLFLLAHDEIELGVGVHGEAGIARVKMMPAKKAVQTLLNYVTRSLELSPEDEVVALVNNLGALSCVEEWLLSGEVAKELSERHIKVVRLYAGRFFTSLNMSGVQVSILKLGERKQLILKALDYKTKAPAWKNILLESSTGPLEIPACNVEKSFGTFRLSERGGSFLKNCFTRIANNLMKEESRLNYLDSACGDGDCGTTFSHLASLIKSHLQDLEFTKPGKLFFELSLMMEESIGGTTGALYGLFFKGISKQLEKCDNLLGGDLSKCWRSGVDTIKKYSKARLGDRTMLDSLETGCETFEREWEGGVGKAFEKALKSAVDGCQRTKSMKAFAGRASYTHESQQKDVDAGAYAVVVWLSAIHQVLNET